ncbi:OLC1v1010055C1 [Oldenlandia corymbosa var. corymbosa]|uniref:OLC1v1010055C1 n=1 Tax=Oldenlandia corymbosa var. corymbosa TaxID=529605 RepID=A0AAV1DQY7_OLDCO|nr:OLC1v1010055C1 [Oldenlandia corymbosa var. corymbosa]
METVQKQQHFVLVHGACHGAWCWFKLKPLLESAGHRVTAMDLSASGINPKEIEEVVTFEEYSLPLLEFMTSLPANEKVILVGHSLGGLNIALVSDKYPDNVLVAVYLTAFMPDSVHAPSYPLDQVHTHKLSPFTLFSFKLNLLKISHSIPHSEKYLERIPLEAFLDTEFKSYGSLEQPLTTMFFGPQFFASKLYQHTSTQDLELAKFLARPSSLFLEDLSKVKPLSKQGYGSVIRAYIICTEDKAIPKDIQNLLIDTVGVSMVKEMEDTDHMPMLSKPQQLCQALQQISDEFTVSNGNCLTSI